MMNKDPDIIISISGAHKSKGIIAAILAEALKNRNVEQVTHIDYDQETFSKMSKIINETDESTLGSATVLFVEFEEDYIDDVFNSSQASEHLTDEKIDSKTKDSSNNNHHDEQNVLRD